MNIRPRKPSGQPAFPQVPHYHQCKGCADRHKWECRERHCVWALLLECVTAAATREHFNTEA